MSQAVHKLKPHDQNMLNAPNKPDFTAWFVLQGLVAAMHHPSLAHMRDDESLRLNTILAEEASKTRLISKLVNYLPYRLQYLIEELVTIKGRVRHFFLRKREIEKQTRALLANNAIRQVVLLGSGLETLCIRLAKEFPAIRFIEIDTHDSQHFKLSVLRTHGISLPANLEYIEGDLRNPLKQILGHSKSFSSNAQTLWLAEGFFMFVPESAVQRIFSEIRDISHRDSFLIFTTVPHKEQGAAIARALQKLYMRKEKCPYTWSIATHQVTDFIEKNHYLPIEQVSYAKLHRGYAPKRSHPEIVGEDIHIAKCWS